MGGKPIMEISVSRMHLLNGEGSKTKAFVDLCFGGAVIVKGFTVVSKEEGFFLGIPSSKGKDEKWYPNIKFINEDDRNTAQDIVLTKYREEMFR